MNELMKFRELLMCAERWCDSPGSTQTRGLPAAQKVTQVTSLPFTHCLDSAAGATGAEPQPRAPQAALLAAVTPAMALCCHLGKLEEQNSGSLWDKLIQSARAEGNSLCFTFEMTL